MVLIVALFLLAIAIINSSLIAALNKSSRKNYNCLASWEYLFAFRQRLIVNLESYEYVAKD